MKLEIYGKNVSITDGMREKIVKKLGFLEKYVMIDEDTTARVVVKVYPLSQKIETTINSRVGLLRSEVMHEDLYAAIDLSIDKLEDQIRKQKTRLSKRHKEKLADTFIIEEAAMEEVEKDIVVKTKQVNAETMDVEEAILRMNMLGHSFFVYTDIDTDKIAICYRRNDGQYGLIETD